MKILFLIAGFIGLLVLFVTKANAQQSSVCCASCNQNPCTCGASTTPEPCCCCGSSTNDQPVQCLELCGMITNDPSTWPTGDLVWDVCRAIAIAEGANVSDSAPDRYNNPGDLSKGDEHGQSVDSYTTLPDGEDLIIFSSKQDGWNALYAKIDNIRRGVSHAYNPGMTWQQIAKKYAGNSAVWAKNVASNLGVTVNDTLGSYFGGNG